MVLCSWVFDVGIWERSRFQTAKGKVIERIARRGRESGLRGLLGLYPLPSHSHPPLLVHYRKVQYLLHVQEVTA